MDLALIKSFVEVSETGSFAAASERLFVTQSAVSLRIQRLEELLGQSLFIRSNAGAELTASGREFDSYARSLLRTWEQARQRIAMPHGYKRSLTLGAQVSLWPRLGFPLLDRLRAEMPDLAIRAEVGMPDDMTRAMTDGVMQISLTYRPTFRPGLSIETLMSDKLVLVAPWEGASPEDLPGRYCFLDWGPDFLDFHTAHFPDLSNPGLILTLGMLAARYVINRGLASYMPARIAKRHLDTGELFLVADAPSFEYRAWSVWRDDLDENLAHVARQTLFAIAETAAGETLDVVDQI